MASNWSHKPSTDPRHQAIGTAIGNIGCICFALGLIASIINIFV